MGLFVQGAPVMLTENQNPSRGLANSSAAILDSLGWDGDDVPDELAFAFEHGGYRIVELEAPPAFVNVAVGGRKWHGIDLPDFRHVLDTDGAGAQVVPIFPSRNAECSSVHGIFAAQKNYAKVYWKSFPLIFAFAMTDFKLQGRTLPKLIVSTSVKSWGRPVMDLVSFYVMISRVTTSAGLRVLNKDKLGVAKLKELRWPAELYSCERSFDGAGRFSAERCKAGGGRKGRHGRAPEAPGSEAPSKSRGARARRSPGAAREECLAPAEARRRASLPPRLARPATLALAGAGAAAGAPKGPHRAAAAVSREGGVALLVRRPHAPLRVGGGHFGRRGAACGRSRGCGEHPWEAHLPHADRGPGSSTKSSTPYVAATVRSNEAVYQWNQSRPGTPRRRSRRISSIAFFTNLLPPGHATPCTTA